MTCLSIVRADLQASLNVMDYNSIDRRERITYFCKGWKYAVYHCSNILLISLLHIIEICNKLYKLDYWKPGRLPYKKGQMCLAIILKRTCKTYQDPVLWAWLIFFTPNYNLFSLLNTLKSTRKGPAMDLLRQNMPRDMKTT